MQIEKDKKIKGVLRFTLLVTIPVLILTVVIISIQACNPFGKCGSPGYTYTRTGTSCAGGFTYNIYWNCSSPCEPSISFSQVTVSTGQTRTSATVYCEDEDYDTGSGRYFSVTCP